MSLEIKKAMEDNACAGTTDLWNDSNDESLTFTLNYMNEEYDPEKNKMVWILKAL